MIYVCHNPIFDHFILIIILFTENDFFKNELKFGLKAT
jgi:hypothetical protein